MTATSPSPLLALPAPKADDAAQLSPTLEYRRQIAGNLGFALITDLVGVELRRLLREQAE